MAGIRFRTEISVKRSRHPVTHQSSLLLLGSCFSDEVGARLRDSGFSVTVNPTGTLYNPLSIAYAMRRFMGLGPDDGPVLVEHDGLWHSMDHHTRFSSPDLEVLRDSIASAQNCGAAAVKEASHLFVTLGSAYVYELADTGRVVANCHKLHPSRFTRRKLTVSDIVDCWSDVLREFHLLNNHVQVIFTVSPIRHMADGLHGNQLSKATLLLAVDELCSLFPDFVSYFPAYEALIDDLRDYRFYAEDLAHPSSVAVSYVYSLLSDSYFSEQTVLRCRECEKEARRSRHRQIGGV